MECMLIGCAGSKKATKPLHCQSVAAIAATSKSDGLLCVQG